jgi:hypothetical protein
MKRIFRRMFELFFTKNECKGTIKCPSSCVTCPLLAGHY